jgi:glutaredoxin
MVSIENGNEIRDQLRSQTGQEHVPYIFLNGKLLPSEQTLLDLKAPGTKIKTLFEKEGLKVTGYFRT